MLKTEFDKELHLYKVGGRIVPSVTQLLGLTLFKGKYDGVDSDVMKRAAEFGNKVHEVIEKDDVELYDVEIADKYYQYLRLLHNNDIDITAKEQMVFYIDKTGELFDFAGTYDMSAVKGDLNLIGEVKTTYSLDVEYISWQLSLYNFISGMKYDKGFVIWLPRRKSQGELVEIELKTKVEVLSFLKMCKEKLDTLDKNKK